MKQPSLLLIPILLLTGGCQSVGILDSGNLQRPALNFQATGARSTTGVLVGQIETGRAASSGVAAGGCSACN
ncbi:MAG: hypothetical protein H7067_04255 [Burkholderiales bacterium]|nr:hypothetical protein [Opitutaceae bacterium]